MGNFLEVRDPNFKKLVKNLESTDSLTYYIALQHTDTVASTSYIVISYNTNSLKKSEFTIASYCGIEDQMASTHIVQ